MLIIQPIGGLCNRMRAINSASHLASLRGEKLTVIWFCNRELGCRFEELFMPTPALHIINIYSKWDFRKIYLQLTSQLIDNETIHVNRTGLILKENFRTTLKKRCYIATEEHFYPAKNYHLFTPIAALQSKINHITSGYSPYMVGVHIRRTDNKPAIGTSSTKAFVHMMQEELECNPDTNFYLATDDVEEEARLRVLFPGRIIANTNKDLSRDSLTGMQDALTDLYCLAATNKIIGSFYSSFTDIAADMHHIPKIIAKSNKE